MTTNTHDGSSTPKFGASIGFRRTLQQRVEAYFAETGLKQHNCPRMYVKTALVLSAFAATYVLLVFFANAWWQALPLAILGGFSMAAIGFNIQHDGGHGSYSSHRWINKLMSMSLDLIGGSSYVWARKHNSLHHTYTNIADHDDDINVGLLGRLSPHQRRLKVHRLQHLYMWVLYGFLPIKWHLYDDFHDVLAGRIGEHRMPRPKRWDLAVFLGGKAFFFTLVFAIPMLLHPWWVVLTFYAIASLAAGVVLAVVFQLAHCVEQAEFPAPSEETGRMSDSWAVHQVKTTVDFAPRSWLASCLLGGLNCQVEHHLFPQVCHVHYPALSKIVEQTCEEFGLKHLSNRTFLTAAASHFRWLKRMGSPQAA